MPAETARRLGTGLLREAMAIRGKVNLASYDRLFPSQDLLPAGGVGNLIALPLFRSARDRNATVFLNLESLEPHPRTRNGFLSRVQIRRLGARWRWGDQTMRFEGFWDRPLRELLS